MKSYMIFLLGFLTLFSCSPEDGAEGAMGPAGPQGVQGIPGETGPKGDTGETNIIASEWIPSGFTVPTPIAESFVQFFIDAPELTDEIKQSGVIMVYGKYGNETLPRIVPLPFLIPNVRNHYYYFQINDINNRISINLYHTENGSIGYPAFEEYRYVLIPPTTTTTGKPSIDYSQMSYDDVVTLLNLEP